MEVAHIQHKELRRLFETGNARGLNAQIVPRLSRMFQFLAAVESIEELLAPPNYGAHLLKGDRRSVWSLTVTRNWRMTFRITDGLKIVDLDLEDYHGA